MIPDAHLEAAQWLAKTNEVLKAHWFIDIADAGFSNEEALDYRNPGQSPEDFVEWLAKKYDLIQFERLEN